MSANPQVSADLFTEFDRRLRSGSVKERVKALPPVTKSLTNGMELAVLIDLIDLLAPTNLLEIGTYYAGTTFALAQAAAVGGGSVVTIDPLGGERVPPIIAAWPERLRSITKFHPLHSMGYFFSLHVAGQAIASKAPFNLIYVDGNHAYPYAVFDLNASAYYLRPSGVMVVDNIDAAGVRIAVENFLAERTHWRHYDDSQRGKHELESISGSSGAILFAPEGMEIGKIPVRFFQRHLALNIVKSIEVPLLPVGARGVLELSANLFFSSPAGVLSNSTVNVSIQIENDADPLFVELPKTLSVTPPADGRGFTSIELELSFKAAGAGNVLLHKDCNIVYS